MPLLSGESTAISIGILRTRLDLSPAFAPQTDAGKTLHDLNLMHMGLLEIHQVFGY